MLFLVICLRKMVQHSIPLNALLHYFLIPDIYVIDETLTSTLRTYLMTLFSVVSTIVVISCVTPVYVRMKDESRGGNKTQQQD